MITLRVDIKGRDGSKWPARMIRSADGFRTYKYQKVYTVSPDGTTTENVEILLFECPRCELPIADELAFACECGSVCLVESGN